MKRFDVSTFICADKDDLSFWKSTLQCTDTKNAHVRVNIETEEEFLAFRKAVEAEAKVHFTVERSKSTERFQWTKVFRCHIGYSSFSIPFPITVPHSVPHYSVPHYRPAPRTPFPITAPPRGLRSPLPPRGLGFSLTRCLTCSNKNPK